MPQLVTLKKLMLNGFMKTYKNGTPLRYFCLENPMDGGAWKAEVLGVAKSQTRLSDFSFTFHFHALEQEMATHSSILAWRILGTGEPVGCRLWVTQSRTRLKRLSSSSRCAYRGGETSLRKRGVRGRRLIRQQKPPPEPS